MSVTIKRSWLGYKMACDHCGKTLMKNLKDERAAYFHAHVPRNHEAECKSEKIGKALDRRRRLDLALTLFFFAVVMGVAWYFRPR